MTIPTELDKAARQHCKSWCERWFPDLVGELAALEDACLDWHRALPRGDRRRFRHDWGATMRNWVRREGKSRGLAPGKPRWQKDQIPLELGQIASTSQRERLADLCEGLAKRVSVHNGKGRRVPP
jgi:hypothetical protein